MKIQIADKIKITAARSKAAFSLVEVTIGMGVIGMSTVALFSGFTSGMFSMQLARENLRATQIMLEKVETIRLYNWTQINTAGFIPSTFTNQYDPQGGTSKGVTYQGTMTISNPPFTNSYSPNIQMVNVRVQWKTGSLDRSREYTTFVANGGMQSYIY